MAKQLPEKLIQSLQGVAGFNEDSFVITHSSPQQVTSIRYNPQKVNATQLDAHKFLSPAGEETTATKVPWCATGRYLSMRPMFTPDPWLHAGAYYVQEASSMFLDHVVATICAGNEPPATVLDLCAAPGGKSSLLASRLTGSFIVLNEVIKNRVTILAENMSKWGSSNVAVTHNDPRDFNRLPGYFDLVAVDAPCSGSGLFRKDEDAIDEWSPENVQHCAMRQQRILQDIVPSIKQNGHLVYSTCSYSAAENEQICDWLVEEFGLAPVSIPIEKEWGITESFSAKHTAPGYRFYPDKLKGEGFFIACLRQQNETKGFDGKVQKLPSASRIETGIAATMLSDVNDLHLFKQKDLIIGFPQKWISEFSTIQKHLNVRKSGVAIGEVKGNGLVPHHELALSALVSDNVNRIELSEEQAQRYLRRQEPGIDTGQKGWALAQFRHLSLGWMKLLGNRVNNYYPTDWRILKP